MFNTHSRMRYDNQLILNYSSHGMLFYINCLVEWKISYIHFYHNVYTHKYVYIWAIPQLLERAGMDILERK